MTTEWMQTSIKKVVQEIGFGNLILNVAWQFKKAAVYLEVR